MAEAVKSPLEMMYQWERQTPDQVFLRQPHNLQWSEYTWRNVSDQVRRIASFLKSKKYPEGSRIAIWSGNSKDWIIVDLAIMLSGHISVPIYPGQDVESARFIFDHSETRLVFAGEFDQAPHFKEALTEGMETVAMLGCTVECDTSLDAVIAENPPCEESPIPDPEGVFTIMYTSGTTGDPKGVMHMHQTPGYVVPDLLAGIKFDRKGDNRLFSFLPLSHAAERILVEMLSLYSNSPVSFSEGLATFADEIRSVQPTFFFAVPRLWVKFKAGVDAMIPPPAQQNLTLEQKQGIASALGLGSARVILTGAAPCPKDVQEWFLDKGIILRDAYGMTENFIHGVVWIHNDTPISGCVGRPFSDQVEVRLSDSDEILFRSKGLMKGYYKNPEKTAEVIVDGWYYTGDSGKFDDEGNLWVTGRVSEVFKTSRGKFIVPARIERLLGRCDELAQFCVCGHGLDQPVLLATLSELGLAMDQSALKSRLEIVIDEVNGELNPWERIAQVFISPEWTIENSLLTPTMKLKRKQIEGKYRQQIDQKIGGEKIVIVQ